MELVVLVVGLLAVGNHGRGGKDGGEPGPRGD